VLEGHAYFLLVLVLLAFVHHSGQEFSVLHCATHVHVHRAEDVLDFGLVFLTHRFEPSHDFFETQHSVSILVHLFEDLLEFLEFSLRTDHG